MLGEFLNAVSAVFLLFMLMGVGYAMGHIGWITATEKRFLSRFIINIAVPMNTLTGILNNFDRSTLGEAGRMLLATLLSITATLLLSVLLAKLLKIPPSRWGVFVSMCSFSNTIFIGLPLTTQLFGEVCIPYVMTFYLVSTVFVQVGATMLIERSGTVKSESTPAGLAKAFFSKPPIIGILCSFALLIAGLRPPELFMSFAHYISNTVSPLALIYCGYILYEVGLKNLRLERGIPTVLVVRLAVAPVICFAMCVLTGVTGFPRSVFIVESALPVVTQVTVLAGAFGADEKYAATGACLTTLGCFISIPILMMVVG